LRAAWSNTASWDSTSIRAARTRGRAGVRSTGEHAMLATPEIACGGYIGFVGPE
jgi:hypothetical protein